MTNPSTSLSSQGVRSRRCDHAFEVPEFFFEPLPDQIVKAFEG